MTESAAAEVGEEGEHGSWPARQVVGGFVIFPVGKVDIEVANVPSERIAVLAEAEGLILPKRSGLVASDRVVVPERWGRSMV